jgi:SAM-dependent methyltransferase
MAAGYEPHAYWEALHDAHRGRLSAVGYAALGEGFNRATYVLRLRAAERILRRALHSTPKRLLEAGVGVGAYEPLWRALGVDSWTGVDLAPTAVEDLRRRFPTGRFIAGDLTADVLPEGSFDLVTAIDVLYHVVDDAGFRRGLCELGRRVAPGGALLVSDIFADVPAVPGGHVRRRPLAAYEEVLDPLALGLADREGVFAILGAPVGRPGSHPIEGALSLIWRVIQKAVRRAPSPLRDGVGSALARALSPLDRALAWTGVSRGANLELALFRRAGGGGPTGEGAHR